MAKDFIGYDNLVDRALRGVVREALLKIQKQGLIGNHYIYLTFKTHDPGVELPEFLRERYPDEMTIVLQNQFSGLRISDQSFEVTLSFQKVPATIVIPFAAMTGFADPGVQFGLQFKNATPAKADAEPSAAEKPDKAESPPARGKRAGKTPAAKSQTEAETPQIVSLDKFRKK